MVDASVVVAAAINGGPVGRWAEGVLESATLYAPEFMPVEATNVL